MIVKTYCHLRRRIRQCNRKIKNLKMEIRVYNKIAGYWQQIKEKVLNESR